MFHWSETEVMTYIFTLNSVHTKSRMERVILVTHDKTDRGAGVEPIPESDKNHKPFDVLDQSGSITKANLTEDILEAPDEEQKTKKR